MRGILPTHMDIVAVRHQFEFRRAEFADRHTSGFGVSTIFQETPSDDEELFLFLDLTVGNILNDDGGVETLVRVPTDYGIATERCSDAFKS